MTLMVLATLTLTIECPEPGVLEMPSDYESNSLAGSSCLKQ